MSLDPIAATNPHTYQILDDRSCCKNLFTKRGIVFYFLLSSSTPASLSTLITPLADFRPRQQGDAYNSFERSYYIYSIARFYFLTRLRNSLSSTLPFLSLCLSLPLTPSLPHFYNFTTHLPSHLCGNSMRLLTTITRTARVRLTSCRPLLVAFYVASRAEGAGSNFLSYASALSLCLHPTLPSTLNVFAHLRPPLPNRWTCIWPPLSAFVFIDDILIRYALVFINLVLLAM